MVRKPTYEELEQRIRDLENEINEIKSTKSFLTRHIEVEEIALLGHWELDLTTDTLYWSDEIYRIFGLSKHEFGATYEAFLNVIHPEDREFVNKAYTQSVSNKTPYDITHRLLLRTGIIKYVREKCKTTYGADGNPIRSLGTVQDITEQLMAKYSFAGIIGRDPQMLELFSTIKDLGQLNVPVLIQGESGTGKELVAAAIHDYGARAGKPFVPVNCSALPEALLESDLFGHIRGAFTGAIRDKKGRFEIANQGTLFLDEIADMPKIVQAKLLRVLQEGTFDRVGDEKTIHSDVRILAAANRDLKEEVEKGNFREDLYYRIRVVPIEIPPLRERKGDIPLLADHFIVEAAREGQYSKGISKKAVSTLIDYSWPGNIRELQSAIRFALIKCRGGTIETEHLPKELQRPLSPPKTDSSLTDKTGDTQTHFYERDGENENKKEKGKRTTKLNRELISRALVQSKGNKALAAKMLGIGRATLYRLLKEQ